MPRFQRRPKLRPIAEIKAEIESVQKQSDDCPWCSWGCWCDGAWSPEAQLDALRKELREAERAARSRR